MAMKSGLPPGAIHKRLYTVLPRPSVAASSSSQHRPRPRSNSASLYTSSNLLPLSFFDSPPAPPSRLPPAPPRLPGEPKQHTNTNPNPLALTPASPATDGSAQLLASSLPYQYPSHPSFDATHTSATPLHRPRKTPHARYQLDVGAYGIPKRCRQSRRPFHTHAPDPLHLAVQVGEDAYFVRDNAMGVADGVGGWARTQPQPDPTPSPSALFARRLMHFTSAQLEPPLNNPSVDPGPVPDLDSHLADLSEGIDVLNILERAYHQTVKVHVQPSTSTPLHTGSSTALVAVLDNVDEPVLKIAHIGDSMGMLVRGDNIVWRSEEMWWAFNTPVQLSPPPRPPTPPLSSLRPSTSTFLSPFSPSSSPSYLPFHPPPIPTTPDVTPRTTAHIVTLPVRPDDILILASDGLSDNLWDEDVLDEVARFRRTWASPSHHPSFPSDAGVTTTSTNVTPGVQISTSTSTLSSSISDASPQQIDAASLRRHTLAGMLSEALCSRARRVSERRPSGTTSPVPAPSHTSCRPPSPETSASTSLHGAKGDAHTHPASNAHAEENPDDTPFARRARELGKSFAGGKRDGTYASVAGPLLFVYPPNSLYNNILDISVLVAIVSPSPALAPAPASAAAV
ncbi:hypothetical protein D9615_007604 [Tricholomella constricta]|uniref:Protein phosphatase n=1 Tax=Tricholomella constricta TaxID=117010 RepID=A0A8H5H7I6_9AGAR|nr:hypothetical protein D9615_007604 [Tricholomella constricta]